MQKFELYSSARSLVRSLLLSKKKKKKKAKAKKKTVRRRKPRVRKKKVNEKLNLCQCACARCMYIGYAHVASGIYTGLHLTHIHTHIFRKEKPEAVDRDARRISHAAGARARARVFALWSCYVFGLIKEPRRGALEDTDFSKDNSRAAFPNDVAAYLYIRRGVFICIPNRARW